MAPAPPRQPGSIQGPVAEAIARQRAIRDYTAEPVTDASLAVLLDAAYRTGTERNRQRWAVIVITDPAQRQRLAAHGDHTSPLQAAPLVLALLQELARHGAHTFWGLLTRTAATIAAHTLMRLCLSNA